MNHAWLWVAFSAFVLTVLALDLGVFHRKAHAVSYKEAGIWVAIWATLAAIFGAGIFYFEGSEKAIQYFTGYIIEQSLSVDNVFLFVVIFSYFKVPPEYRHRVLFWGVLGALVMRGIMILAGAALIHRFEWVVYIFGGFLILTGIKMFLHRDDEPDISESKILKFVQSRMRVTNQYDGQRFFTNIDGKRVATPLFLVLVLIEFTDLVFAVDSIPAIFGVTRDPFIVYTSNVFAIMGLRSLYFLLAGVMELFKYLQVGLSFVLAFVGTKMLLTSIHIKIPALVSLGIIVGILLISILASIIELKRENKHLVLAEDHIDVEPIDAAAERASNG